MMRRMLFQSTRPRRRDTRADWRYTPLSCFNPRAREGATDSRIGIPAVSTSFNPRAREGATYINNDARNVFIVSIHAPAKARHKRMAFIYVISSFNPRAREGATKSGAIKTSYLKVSIHAPAKARPNIIVNVRQSRWFQSTRPRRRDKRDRVTGASIQVFQSTRPRRRDNPVSARRIGQHVSIHAPAKARQYNITALFAAHGFNPRAREGATRFVYCKSCKFYVSIHAPAKARRYVPSDTYDGVLFQSTRPRRRDF